MQLVTCRTTQGTYSFKVQNSFMKKLNLMYNICTQFSLYTYWQQGTIFKYTYTYS